MSWVEDPFTGKRDTFQYIPLLKVLSLICYDHSVARQIFRPDFSVPLTDFNNGNIYQENQFFSTNEPHLRIQLYSDEFDDANPLLSKKLLNKVSAFYFIVENIPPKHRSASRQLLLLLKHRLVKTYAFRTTYLWPSKIARWLQDYNWILRGGSICRQPQNSHTCRF